MTNASSLDSAQVDQLAINTARFLSVDAIEKADRMRTPALIAGGT